MQSGRQTARRLIIFRRSVRQPFYFGCTRTPGHLSLGVLVKFSGLYNTPVRPLTKALLPLGVADAEMVKPSLFLNGIRSAKLHTKMPCLEKQSGDWLTQFTWKMLF